MVTRETSYIGQLYFGLSTDDPTVVEWHNGDRILVMDQDKMLVYDEAAATFKPISMGGGGGGGGLVLKGSGSYTQTTTISSSSAAMKIPVSGITDPAMILVDADSVVSGVAQTKSWFRQYYIDTTEAASEFTNTLYQYMCFNSGGTSSRNGAGGRIYHIDNARIEALMATGSFPIQANTYNWYWWQKEE